MKRNLALAGAIVILFGGSASAGDFDTAPGHHGDETSRRGVLCGVWMTRNFIERVIGVDQDAQSFSQTTYPVPAPIWVAQSINSTYLSLKD